MLLTPMEETRRRRRLWGWAVALSLAGGGLFFWSVGLWAAGQALVPFGMDVAGLVLVVAGDRAGRRAEGR